MNLCLKLQWCFTIFQFFKSPCIVLVRPGGYSEETNTQPDKYISVYENTATGDLKFKIFIYGLSFCLLIYFLHKFVTRLTRCLRSDSLVLWETVNMLCQYIFQSYWAQLLILPPFQWNLYVSLWTCSKIIHWIITKRKFSTYLAVSDKFKDTLDWG